jgi:hypothetical protein
MDSPYFEKCAERREKKDPIITKKTFPSPLGRKGRDRSSWFHPDFALLHSILASHDSYWLASSMQIPENALFLIND